MIFEQLEEVYGDEWANIEEKFESYASVALFRKLVSLEMDFVSKYKLYKTLFLDPPKVKCLQEYFFCFLFFCFQFFCFFLFPVVLLFEVLFCILIVGP